MPEGDTIWRAARTLQKVLGGQTVIAAASAVPTVPEAALSGRTVTRVESRGKNLLIHFDDGATLYTHMRMTGSWHVYRPREAWQRPTRQARVVLETSAFVAVCFNAPVVQLLSPAQLLRHPTLSRLGPDVLAPAFDGVAARARIRARPDLSIAEALLAQSALSGIGNIYKSETLFLCGIHPFAPVAELSDAEIDRLVSRARSLMSASLGGSPRATRPSLSRERTWVYARRGRPCHRCGAAILMRRQGTQARSTYWCPECQRGKGERPAAR